MQTAGLFTNMDKSMQLTEWLNGINIDNWNRVNEYNKPVNVMNRLKQAGINPQLIAGSLGSAGQASSIPASSYVNSPDFAQVGTGLLSNFLNLYQGMLQGEQTKANINNINANTNNANLKNAMDNYIFVHQFPWQTKNLQYTAENILQRNILLGLQQKGQEISNATAQKRLVDFMPLELEMLGVNRDAAKYNYDWMLPAQLNNLRADTIGKRRHNYNLQLRNRYLATYGIENPGSSNAFGVPLSLVFGGDDFVNRYANSAKGVLKNMFSFYKDLFTSSKDFFKDLFKEKLLPGFQSVLGGLSGWMNSVNGVQPFK